MEQENLYNKIQEVLGNLQGTFNILEEQIDLDTQLEYFELSKNIKKSIDRDEAFNDRENLFSDTFSPQEKKSLLAKLASIDKVEAFRVLERYRKEPAPELKDWASLALQESKMLMESSILDENQVFISTGLGGKGQKLRYFIVFLAKDNIVLDALKKKIIKNEMDFIFKKNNIEVEELKFFDIFSTIKAIIPIQIQLQQIFEEVIDNCNQFGDFLQNNFIVTNVKELSFDEITEVLKTSQLPDKEETD